MDQSQPYRIVIEDGLMTVMDANGDGHDCHVLADGSLADANAQIDRWAKTYRINVAAAKRDLAAYANEL